MKSFDHETIFGKDLCVVRDPHGLLMLVLKPYRHVCAAGEEWESFAYISLDEKRFPEVTWESEPLRVTLVPVDDEDIDDNTMWLGRNKDESLCLSHIEPHRNEVNPWWSCPGKLCWYDEDLFPEIDWTKEPIRVSIVKCN